MQELACWIKSNFELGSCCSSKSIGPVQIYTWLILSADMGDILPISLHFQVAAWQALPLQAVFPPHFSGSIIYAGYPGPNVAKQAIIVES